MKTKYERLSKKEKQEVIKKFKEKKYDLYKKFRNMVILCNIGITYSLIAFFYDLLVKKIIFYYIIDIIILIFSLCVLLKVNKIKKDILNDFILKK